MFFHQLPSKLDGQHALNDLSFPFEPDNAIPNPKNKQIKIMPCHISLKKM